MMAFTITFSKKLAEENDPDMFLEGYEDTVKAMFMEGMPITARYSGS